MLLLVAFEEQHGGHGLRGDAEVEQEAGELDVFWATMWARAYPRMVGA